MRKIFVAALAVASLTASAAGAQTVLGAQPEVRADTVVRVQGRPPWANCVRWDARTLVCRDPGWRNRNWRAWYGRSTCRRGHGWWIDNRGRWRRC